MVEAFRFITEVYRRAGTVVELAWSSIHGAYVVIVTTRGSTAAGITLNNGTKEKHYFPSESAAMEYCRSCGYTS